MASKTDITEQLVCCYCIESSNSIQYLADEQGIYERMIKDTFNIQVCHWKQSTLKMICDKCVKDLCFAAKVKRKILDAQKLLWEQNKNIDKQDDMKLEIDNEFNDSGYCNSFDDDDDNVDMDSRFNNEVVALKTGSGDNVANSFTNVIEIKIEPSESNELRKKQTKRRKNDSNDSTKYIKKSLMNMEYVMNDINKKSSDNDAEQSPLETKAATNELALTKVNTFNLLRYSNMCLFKSKRTKFACYFCKKSFLDIRDVRTHSLSHSADGLKIDLSRCRGLSYKNVDISNLTCKLCSIPCENLPSLQDHLTNKHDVVFGNIGHFLQPYKLEDGFNCLICKESFNTFCRLSIHMNSHSTSNVCETCGVAYTNRISLRNHINSMHTEKKCSKCAAVFPNTAAKVKHLRIAHNSGKYKRYCMKCDMTCQYSYQLMEHMIEKHGVERQLRNCEHCGKICRSPIALKTHIRSVHVGERNYVCGVCEMGFFTSSDRKRHERTHDDEKSFSCNLCEVKFRSKDSVRRHLKRQHGNCKVKV